MGANIGGRLLPLCPTCVAFWKHLSVKQVLKSDPVALLLCAFATLKRMKVILTHNALGCTC